MERFKFTLGNKIIFFIIEVIIIGNVIYNMSIDIIISIICYILFIIIITFENCYYSILSFSDNIIITNSFRKKLIKYNEIKQIKIFKEMRYAFFIGAEINIELSLKNNKTMKIHLGPIIMYRKLILLIKEIAKKKCIKILIIELYKHNYIIGQ